MSYLGRSAKLSLKAQEKVSFLATAGQTSKTGLSYTVGFIEVYVNGVLLTDTTDFTATNGNSITFTVALLLNDEVTVISLKTFTVADHYTKSDADTLLAAKAKLTKSTTAPSSPAAGDQWFDTTSTVNAMKVYNGNAWKFMSDPPFSATGGTITTSGAYTIHTFASSGTFTPSATGSVDYLVVAGGGSGAGRGSGAYARGSNGSNSVFTSITAIGGGAGAAWDSGAGSAGGSGGGAAAGNNNNDRVGGAGTSGQGNAGGTGGNFGGQNLRGGGGGGAGAVGGNASSNQNGAGGAGLANSYSGSSVMYAGGGGGAGDDGSGAGHGGGGAGGMLTGTGLLVLQGANTVTIGGGGASTNVSSGAGGSGIVVVRYLT